ncbi:MAG: hypothetical protein ACRD1Z_23160, partial [Vicinamibacteria bacterium]
MWMRRGGGVQCSQLARPGFVSLALEANLHQPGFVTRAMREEVHLEALRRANVCDIPSATLQFEKHRRL